MCKNLMALYDYADKENINVCYFPLKDNISIALPNKWICIDTDRLQTSAEETIHLAHELGHIATHSFYNVNSRFVLREKLERRADRWAITHLIPCDKLQEAVSGGICDLWELADYFNVTEDFLIKAVEYYKQKECL